MKHIIVYTDEVPSKINGWHYTWRVVKSPVFWMVFIFLVLFSKYWQSQLDPLSIPYPSASLQFISSQKYLSSNFAALNRLGNHLFEVFSIFAIAKKLGRTPMFFVQDGYHERMLKDLRDIVPDLMDEFTVVNGSVPKTVKNTTFHEKCCVFEDPKVLEEKTEQYLHLNGTHYQSWKYFTGMREDIISYLKEATNPFNNLPESSDTSFVKCVHVRRGDFIEFLIPIADRIFIVNAMKMIEEREGRPRIKSYTVFFGDDFEFMDSIRNETSSDDSFVSEMSPADDLLYAKDNCDLVLITAPHSTFGWWLGYFSKGNRVYYNDIRYTNDFSYIGKALEPSDYFLPHWTPLKYSSPENFTVVESFIQ